MGKLRNASLRHATHYQRVARRAGNLYAKGGRAMTRGLTLFEAEWANIQAGQRWAEASASHDRAAARLCSAYPDAATDCLALRQHPRERVRWLQAGLDAARQHLAEWVDC